MRWRPSNNLLAHLLLLSTVFVWGATFSLVKDALRDISPLLFNLFRMALATFFLVLINLRHLGRTTRSDVLFSAVVGLFLASGYQFQTAGLAETTPTKSAFLTGLVVVFVPLLTKISWLRPKRVQQPGIKTIFGTVVAFAGLILLTTPAGASRSSLLGSISRGDLLTLLCALAFAGHLLALARFSPEVPIRQLATFQVGFAAFFMACTLPLGGAMFVHVTPRLVLALGITSLFATAAAFWVQSWSQQYLSASHTAVILTLEPVFALGISVIFGHEQLSARALAGSTLIFAGLLTIECFASPPVKPVPA